MTERKSLERDLALTAARQLRAREKRTARSLLRVEAAVAKNVKRAVAHATASLQVEVAHGRAAASAVRRAAPSLQSAVAHDLGVGRSAARAAGRAALSTETELAFPLTLSAAELDAAASFVAAASLSGRWGAEALQIVAADSSFAALPARVSAAVQQIAATETARAFNNERDQLLVQLGLEGSKGHGTASDVPAAGMFKVWSAVLDGRTCSRCFAVDGEIVELAAKFSAGVPPLHPNCRCVIEHIMVPKPQRLEDVSIDYDLFKQELRNVIREGRAESERHAVEFASASLGERRSPLTLTKRFREERYATRR